MSECEKIAYLLEQTFEGSAYYGKSVLKSLEGVTAEIAARKAPGQANSIWELVVHLTLELNYHREFIEGTAEKWIAGETTWKKIEDFSVAAWEKTLDRLRQSNRGLVSAINQSDDSLLEQKAAPLDWTFRRALNGTMHHSIYHAGQITILRRLSE